MDPNPSLTAATGLCNYIRVRDICIDAVNISTGRLQLAEARLRPDRVMGRSATDLGKYLLWYPLRPSGWYRTRHGSPSHHIIRVSIEAQKNASGFAFGRPHTARKACQSLGHPCAKSLRPHMPCNNGGDIVHDDDDDDVMQTIFTAERPRRPSESRLSSNLVRFNEVSFICRSTDRACFIVVSMLARPSSTVWGNTRG